MWLSLQSHNRAECGR